MNDCIYEARKKAGVRQWQIAEELGLREDVFSRLMRHELSDEDRERILQAIRNIAERRSHEKTTAGPSRLRTAGRFADNDDRFDFG